MERKKKMYSYISGKLIQKESNKVVIDVNGIGYEIGISQYTFVNLPNVDETVKIYTYLSVKEDEMSLYGFGSSVEKQMFLNLTTISGIGPKTAIGILSNISISDLALAIISNDSSLLYNVKGIGKKTADRIVLELNEKLENISQFDIDNQTSGGKEMEDAVLALTALGMSRIDAVKSARTVASNGDKAEDIIRKSLKSNQ